MVGALELPAMPGSSGGTASAYGSPVVVVGRWIGPAFTNCPVVGGRSYGERQSSRHRTGSTRQPQTIGPNRDSARDAQCACRTLPLAFAGGIAGGAAVAESVSLDYRTMLSGYFARAILGVRANLPGSRWFVAADLQQYVGLYRSMEVFAYLAGIASVGYAFGAPPVT